MNRRFALAAFVLALPLAHAAGPARDDSTERLSDHGLYRVSWRSDPAPIPLRKLHTWTLRVTRPDGTPVTDATIAVDGDMPEHGHGLPTRPRAGNHTRNGEYVVEGVKFQMGGWWVMDFDITSGGRTDRVRFNLQLSK